MLKQFITYSAIVTGCLLNSSLSAQQCEDGKTSLTPDSRYQFINHGQEVKDLKTGLIWQRCLMGESWDGQQCTGDALGFPSEEAKQYLGTQAKNWRVPTIAELTTLNGGCWQPAINPNIFPSNPERFYSDSTLISSTPYTPTKSEAAHLYDRKNAFWYWAFDVKKKKKSFEVKELPVHLVRK